MEKIYGSICLDIDQISDDVIHVMVFDDDDGLVYFDEDVTLDEHGAEFEAIIPYTGDKRWRAHMRIIWESIEALNDGVYWTKEG